MYTFYKQYKPKQMKKAILKLNGKDYEVELTEKQVNEITKEDKPYANDMESLYYIDTDGTIKEDYSVAQTMLSEIAPNESKNRKNLERALAYIKIKNWADHYNDVDNDVYLYCINPNMNLRQWAKGDTTPYILFSSRELARQARDLFKEDFKLLYSQD